jgi:hypothetical protein
MLSPTKQDPVHLLRRYHFSSPKNMSQTCPSHMPAFPFDFGSEKLSGVVVKTQLWNQVTLGGLLLCD